MSANRLSNQAIVGLIVVLIGVVLLADSLDIVQTGGILRWWPSLLIIVGVWRLVVNRLTNVVGPVVLISIGAFLQMIFLGYDVGDLWPVALILLGVLLLFGGSRFRDRNRHAVSTDAINTVNALGIFSEAKVRSASDSFEGGQATAIFGGVNLDFTGATVPTPPAYMEVTVMFGGAEIRVPKDWVVKVEAPVVFGGADDKRFAPTPQGSRTPELVIRGLVLFGGITLKD